AVQADPALEPDADRRDLVLVTGAALRPRHPHADALLAPLAADVEAAERADQPFLQRRHEQPHVGAPLPDIQHEIDHALARTVIGELAAAAGFVDREAPLDQAAAFRAGARGVERRGFAQPHQLPRAPARA